MEPELTLLFPSPEDAKREATRYGTPDYGAHINVRLVQIEEGGKIRNMLRSGYDTKLRGLADLTLRLYFSRRISDGKLDGYVETGYSEPFHLSFDDVAAMHKRAKQIERKLEKMQEHYGDPQGPADMMFRLCLALGIKRVAQRVGLGGGCYDDCKYRFGKIADGCARFYESIAKEMEAVIPKRTTTATEEA